MRDPQYLNVTSNVFTQLRDTEKIIEALLLDVVGHLVADEELPKAQRDHGLMGDWVGYRECHIKPDLLLIYRLPDAKTLRLARLGSYSELFG